MPEEGDNAFDEIQRVIPLHIEREVVALNFIKGYEFVDERLQFTRIEQCRVEMLSRLLINGLTRDAL